MMAEQSAFTVTHMSAPLPSIITLVRGNTALCMSCDLQGALTPVCRWADGPEADTEDLSAPAALLRSLPLLGEAEYFHPYSDERQLDQQTYLTCELSGVIDQLRGKWCELWEHMDLGSAPGSSTDWLVTLSSYPSGLGFLVHKWK